jgi:hypothetical protein
MLLALEIPLAVFVVYTSVKFAMDDGTEWWFASRESTGLQCPLG